MDVPWLNGRDERAWRGLQLMQLHLEAELARQLARDSHLSYPDYLVLVALTDDPQGSLRSFELGAALGWEKSRLSHHVARMVARGLVERQQSEADRRGTVVAVTKAGRREIEAAAPGHVRTVRSLFIDRLTPSELNTIARAAAKVSAAIDERRRQSGSEPDDVP